MIDRIQNDSLNQNVEALVDVYDPNAHQEPWAVTYCGGRYLIKKDITRARTAAKWFIKRMNDRRISVRYYSRPSGAFLALSEGAIKWSQD
jgi:hypothetical protein